MYVMEKCRGVDRHSNACTNHSIVNTRFCSGHSYMNDLTDEMLNNVKLCTGCNRMNYFDSELKTCNDCRIRSADNRVAKRENVILCKKEGCRFKRSSENEFCGKHQICMFKKETLEMGKKICSNYLRGCRQQLDIEYKFSTCGDCLEKAREKDNIRNSRIEIPVVKLENKYCPSCHKEYPLDQFVGIKTPTTKRCKCCRDKDKIRDAKRDPVHRLELARIAERKPERQQVKNDWKQHNYVLIAGHWVKDPAMIRKIIYNKYQRTSVTRNINFDLEFDDFCNIINTNCYYCGVLQEQGFNGIDRKESNKHYSLDNSVSCCQICNYIKGSLDYDIFLKRIEHILFYNKRIENGIISNQLFGNHNSINYSSYKCGALNRELQFDLTIQQFLENTGKNCYICGKENIDIHKNGIDRMDSNIGYIIDNCMCCCGECNIMKKDYTYDELFEKFILIYNFSIKDKIIDYCVPEIKNRIFVKLKRI